MFLTKPCDSLGSGLNPRTERILSVSSVPVEGSDEKVRSTVEPAEDDKGLCG